MTMDFLPTLLKLRSISDPILITQDLMIYIITLALVGLGLGLTTAWFMWARSAKLVALTERHSVKNETE